MLPAALWPGAELYLLRPASQVEPTAIAALNLNWPGSKLTVCVLDDGRRPEMARLVRRLAFQCRYMQAGPAAGRLGRVGRTERLVHSVPRIAPPV